MSRTRVAAGLAVLGVTMGTLAILGFAMTPRDSGIVPASDVSTPRPSGTQAPTSTTSTTLFEAPEPELWSVNPVSGLAEVPLAERPAPVALRIETLGIDAPIGAYGVAPDGRMDVPDNVTEVGWYEHGPSPGQSGSAVLAAHVDLAGPGRGLFYDLDELDPGAEVAVRFSNGEEQVFEVVGRRVYLKSELPLDAIFRRDGDPVLTLVTCGGGFSRSDRSYDSNVVVYAVPVTVSPSSSGAG